MVKCKHKKNVHQNLKDSEKNNKEILKFQQLLNNKDNKEEFLIKPKDNKSLKKLNNMKLNIKLLNKLKHKPEETLN